MVKEGIPFVLATLMLAAVFAVLYFWIGGIVFLTGIGLFLLLTAFMAYFFRDPQRNVPGEAGIVVSAADGRVTRVETRENGKFVSVFLSPLDVHINRAPIAGTVTHRHYIAGAFVNADLDKASEDNERQHFLIERHDGLKVGFTQIAGLVARRIVAHVKPGDIVAAGQRIGLIRFGSRVDVYLPACTRPRVLSGQRTVAGETVIAEVGDGVERIGVGQ